MATRLMMTTTALLWSAWVVGGLEVAAGSRLVFARDELLVSAARLHAELSDCVVIDMISADDFAADPACVPGSRRCWRDDCERTRDGVSGLLPLRRDFQALARSLGVSKGTDKVVIVDRCYDATRLWWLFLVFGTSVRVLDGGFAAWREGGFPVASQHSPRVVVGAESTYEARHADERLIATARDVDDLSAAERPNLWDVRSKEEYDGAICVAGAARPGRIPWTSGRLDHGVFRDPNFGAWRPNEEIRDIAAAALDDEGLFETDVRHTFYCQSAVRTTQLIFGLALAGKAVEDLVNYDGSWIEWSATRPGTATDVPPAP